MKKYIKPVLTEVVIDEEISMCMSSCDHHHPGHGHGHGNHGNGHGHGHHKPKYHNGEENPFGGDSPF